MTRSSSRTSIARRQRSIRMKPRRYRALRHAVISLRFMLQCFRSTAASDRLRRLSAIGAVDPLHDRLDGRCGNQRDRVRGPVRDRASPPTVCSVDGIRGRRDPELDPEPALGVEGPGARRVRARDRGLRDRSRCSRWWPRRWPPSGRSDHVQAHIRPDHGLRADIVTAAYLAVLAVLFVVQVRRLRAVDLRRAQPRARRVAVAPPGVDRRAGEPHAVAEVPALLGAGGVLARSRIVSAPRPGGSRSAPR